MNGSGTSAGSLAGRLDEHLDRSRLIEGAPTVLAAVSGGADSTALAVLLAPRLRRTGVALAIAHVAHGLRGKAGDGDAHAAGALADSLGVPFTLLTVDLGPRRRNGESLEAAARAERYHALLARARELGPEALVATGHTRDDQAETVLLNLERRSGRLRGAIRERRADGVVRPLLPFARAELRAFLRETRISWREDETNLDERFARNRLRRSVLPALESASPGAAARLARAGAAWNARLEALDAELDRALAASGSAETGPFPRALLGSLAPEAAARLLLRAAGQAGRAPGGRQLTRVVTRLTAGEDFEEALAGRTLVADRRLVRLLPRRKTGRPSSKHVS